MISSDATTTALSRTNRLLPIVACAVLGIAFFLTEHDLGRSRLESLAVESETMEVSVESGSAQRQLGFSLVAALGVYCLWAGGGRSWRLDDPLAVLVLAGVAWCAASVAWSVDPALTAKRVAALGFCLVGVAGISRQLSARQLCVAAATVLTAYCLFGVAAEIALGTFRPWAEEYRFAGTVHPNTQGVYCAALCLAAAALAGRGRGHRLPLVLFAVAAALLLLTKSRTALAGAAVGLSVIVLPRIPRRARVLTGVAAAWAASMLLLCGAIAGGVADRATDALLLGRTEDTASLSGRVPLWTDLAARASDRLWLGHGYDSFWNAENIEDISADAGWAICSAHSLYLDVVLGVGLIGAGLLLAAGAIGLGRLGSRYLATAEPGSGFFFGLLVFGAVAGLLESTFVQPSFVALVAACGLAQAAFFPKEDATP
jgi:exopolysaccharide production protein ExoQ